MKVALIGYSGYWGEKLARVLPQLGHQIVQWIDSKNEKDLENTDADAAIIATPPSTHYQLALRAMKLGLDVLLEKPMAMKASHSFELCQFAQDNDIVLSVDSTFVHTAAFDYLHSRTPLRGGGGQLFSYQSLRLAPPMPQAQIEAGWDLVCHDVAILQALGVVGSRTPCVGIEDGPVANAVFCLPTGGSAFIQASRAWPKKVREITLQYSDSTYLWTLDGLQTLDGKVVVEEKEEPLKRLLIDFDERVQNRWITGKTDGLHGAEVVGCLERLYAIDEAVGLGSGAMGYGVRSRYAH